MAISSVSLATLVFSYWGAAEEFMLKFFLLDKGKLRGSDSWAVAVISTPPGTSRFDKIMVVSPNASRAKFMAARVLGAKNFCMFITCYLSK